MANRFDNGSISAYTPETFEELAFLPMLKRKKHDNLLAQQELMRAGLAKVDPYDKHFNEAIRIKQDLEKELDNTALELSNKGFSNDMTSKVIGLNRRYNDTIAPTGALGQINAEKQNILKIHDEYDKLAQQKGWSETETNYWKQKALEDYNKKPIYDDKGKILNYSGPKEIANKIDYNERLHKLASAAGMTTEEFKQGMPIAVGQDASGYFTQGHQMKGWSKASNNPQVAAAYNTLIQELNDPTSELRKSAEYERRDLNSLAGILGTQKDIYLKNQKSNESDYTIDHFGSGPDKTKDPEDPNNPDSIPEAVITINSNEDLLNDLKNFKPNTLIPYSAIPIDPKDTSENKTFIRKQNEINRLNNTYEKKLNNNPEYIDLAQKIINQSPSLKGLKITDQKVVNATLNYLNKHQNTQTVNRIITPTTSKDTRGYSADEISKYTKMKQDAMETSIRNGMKVFDENGNEIKKPVSSNIIYNGEYTFNSVVPIKHTNSKTKFAPIAATMLVKGDNGVTEEHKVYVEQNPDREKDPLFKAQYIAFQTLNKANKYRGLKQPLKNTFTEENLGLRDVNVIYNDDGSIRLEGKHYNGKNWEKMPPQDFQNDSDFVNYIHNLYN